MRSSLLIGRFGPLSVSLNYTWLFISVLGLWGLALVWLPDNFPQWSSGLYWLVAIAVMGLFLLSLILRELVRAAIAGFDRRGITLYPFGAATPYRLDEIGTGRALVSMVVAPLFNLVAGITLLVLAGTLEGASGLGELTWAMLVPLAWLNLWVGVINLIPGIPFDGGRVLTNTLFWFSGQREQGLGFTRTVGEITSLGLVLLGAWIGLTSQNWIVALALVVLGWGAREAEEKGKQLSILRTGLSEIKAGDIMEEAAPQDRIPANASVAQMMYSHQYYATDKPLPVMKRGDEGGGSEKMVGVVTLAQAEDLLQGDWPTTPVTSLMSSPTEVTSLAPGTPLAEVIELIEKRGTNADEQAAVPVIAGGELLGSIDPARLAAFEQAEFELGAVEAPLPDGDGAGFFARIKGVLPALTVLIALAILGNVAISSDPYSLRNISRAEAAAPIAFADMLPSPGALVSGDVISINAIAISAQTITTASLTLDGTPLPVSLAGANPYQQVISAQALSPGDGIHTLVLVVADRIGRLGRTEWQFWEGAIGTPTPTTAASVSTLEIGGRQPAPGGLVLAQSPAESRIGFVISWEEPISGVQLLIDGIETPAALEPVAGTGNQYRVTASTANLTVGSHTIRANIAGNGGIVYATDWTFQAIVPDDQNAYFEQTGLFVSGAFYDFWTANGGLDIFGYPISDRVSETDPDTGEVYTAQYFERARFELHPSLGNTVLLGRLGLKVHMPDPPATANPDANYFTETGHNLSGQFLEFWQTRGGLAIFGYPISEELTETSPQDGNEYVVQYFERAKFELHPELAGTPYEVQIAQLGTLVYQSR